MTKLKDETIRKGCKDVFNAFLVKDESFDGIFDIPVCKFPKELCVSFSSFRNLLSLKVS